MLVWSRHRLITFSKNMSSVIVGDFTHPLVMETSKHGKVLARNVRGALHCLEDEKDLRVSQVKGVLIDGTVVADI